MSYMCPLQVCEQAGLEQTHSFPPPPLPPPTYFYIRIKQYRKRLLCAFHQTGLLVFAAILYSRLLSIPLVVSYHTHVPHYIPLYTFKWLVEPMWAVIRFCHRMADLTLVTSNVMKKELASHDCRYESMVIFRLIVQASKTSSGILCAAGQSTLMYGKRELTLSASIRGSSRKK